MEEQCGQMWSPVSSRIVSARLKLSDQVVSARRPLLVSVVNVYTPIEQVL